MYENTPLRRRRQNQVSQVSFSGKSLGVRLRIKLYLAMDTYTGQAEELQMQTNLFEHQKLRITEQNLRSQFVSEQGTSRKLLFRTRLVFGFNTQNCQSVIHSLNITFVSVQKFN